MSLFPADKNDSSIFSTESRNLNRRYLLRVRLRHVELRMTVRFQQDYWDSTFIQDYENESDTAECVKILHPERKSQPPSPGVNVLHI